jgi:hypothetical protein
MAVLELNEGMYYVRMHNTLADELNLNTSPSEIRMAHRNSSETNLTYNNERLYDLRMSSLVPGEHHSVTALK